MYETVHNGVLRNGTMDWSPAPQPASYAQRPAVDWNPYRTPNILKNADSLREEAGRSRRLGKTSADKKVKAALLAYALELEARAARMSAMTPPAPEAERREDQR